MGVAVGGKAVAKEISNSAENQFVENDPGLMDKAVEGIANWANKSIEDAMNTDFSDSHND